MADHEHGFFLVYSGPVGFHCGHKGCNFILPLDGAIAILNKYTKLKRVRDVAQARRQAAKSFAPLDEIQKINKELDDALADTQESE